MPIDRAGGAHWCNREQLVWRYPTALTLDLRPIQQEGIYAKHRKPSQKSMNGEVIGPRQELITV